MYGILVAGEHGKSARRGKSYEKQQLTLPPHSSMRSVISEQGGEVCFSTNTSPIPVNNLVASPLLTSPPFFRTGYSFTNEYLVSLCQDPLEMDSVTQLSETTCAPCMIPLRRLIVRFTVPTTTWVVSGVTVSEIMADSILAVLRTIPWSSR